MCVSVAFLIIRVRTRRIARGLGRMIGYLLRKRVNLLSSSLVLNMVRYRHFYYSVSLTQKVNTMQTVWCWGWDGAGDLDGPDVDPIWERMPNKSTRAESVLVKHDRSIRLEGGVGLGI